jgi:TetR/AcrR family transcriptional repressor of nem operon
LTVRHEKLALSRKKLLDAALFVIRAKGYEATTVDDICESAGLSKGSFFHHFKSKEDLALAAAGYWIEGTTALFASAPYHAPADPLDRLLAYVDFRKSLLMGDLPDYTCLVGTMVQETYDTHPAIRQACETSISGHAATLVPDIEAAIRQRGICGNWTAESLALYTQATIQGAFILAKVKPRCRRPVHRSPAPLSRTALLRTPSPKSDFLNQASGFSPLVRQNKLDLRSET